MRVPLDKAQLLLRYRDIDKVLRLIAESQVVSLKEVRNRLDLGTKSAWLVLHGLLRTEHLKRKGKLFEATAKIREDAVLLNLRDSESDFLYRNKGIRTAAFYVLSGATNMADIARITGISYPTIIRGLRILKKAGMLCNGGISQSFLYRPADPLETIPREAARVVVEYFVRSLSTFSSRPIPVILHGKAAWGKPSTSLNFMVLLKQAEGTQAMFQVMQDVLKAAENVTAHYGISVELAATTEDAWLMHQLKIVATTHPLLQEATFGISIYGAPPQEDEFFSLMQLTHPWPVEKIRRAVERGYLLPVGDKFVFTEKGIRFMKKDSPSLVEVPLHLGGKQIRLITIPL